MWVELSSMGKSLGENIEFLRALDKRVHYIIKERTLKLHCRDSYETRDVDKYYTTTMDAGSLERALGIVKKEDLVFFPYNTEYGFSIGFCVAQIEAQALGVQPEVTPILQFLERQLPEEYGWDRLSKVFLRTRNKELITYAGLEPIHDFAHYCY